MVYVRMIVPYWWPLCAADFFGVHFAWFGALVSPEIVRFDFFGVRSVFVNPDWTQSESWEAYVNLGWIHSEP